MRRRWWLLLVCLPVGLMVGLLASSVLIYIQPKLFESTAVVEIKPSAMVSLPDADGDTPESDPRFLENEMTHLTSPEVMRRAVEKGAFDKRWGMTEDEAVAEMGRSVRVQRIQGTDLISIRAISVFRQDAPEMAKAVADGYKEDRVERMNKDSAQALDELKQSVKHHEAQVEERRKKLMEAERKKVVTGGILGLEPEGPMVKNEEAEAMRSTKLDLLVEKVSASMGDQMLIIHESPQVPMKPSGPDAMRYLLPCMAGGLGAGALIGLLLVLLFPKRVMG